MKSSLQQKRRNPKLLKFEQWKGVEVHRAIQHKIEALIVDTPLHEYFQQFEIKPQAKRKKKIMPPVLTHLVDKDIIELFEETWEKQDKNKKLKISKDVSVMNQINML